MVENYDILKQNNLNQLVAEYESEQQTLCEKRNKDIQRRHDYMKDVALQELQDIRERQYEREAEPECYIPSHFHCLISQYTVHKYNNARAALERRYAIVYDKNNLDKYPKPTPLPKMQDIMDPFMPHWMTYEKLKALAAYCPKWRQR